MVGTFGNAATFSFYPGKNLGAYGDAGCIVTNDDRLADWCATFARHGGKGDHVMEGINSRMDGLQAAILSVKLPHLAQWTQARQRVAARYNELLADVGDLVTPKVAPGRMHVYHLYVVCTAPRDALREQLTAAGVSTVINYPKALPFYPAYAYLGAKPADFPIAHANQSRILSLPIYPEMTDEMIDYVADTISGFYARG
jgi:dTDP-4-amino-4,6-dideoxygalactose transaminase